MHHTLKLRAQHKVTHWIITYVDNTEPSVAKEHDIWLQLACFVAFHIVIVSVSHLCKLSMQNNVLPVLLGFSTGIVCSRSGV